MMLYELLAGALPIDADVASDPLALREALRDADFPSPSARFESLGDSREEVASARATGPAPLRRTLQGDIDWIIGKALERDPARRYASADALVRDIERHLAHEPIEARPPSAGYRLRKFVRRNKTGVVAAGVVAVTLVAGLVSTTTLWLRATAAERQAAVEAATANEVSEFLAGLFKMSSPYESLGDSVTAREMLDRGAERIEEELANQPLVQAPLMATLGSAYNDLGLYEEAVSMHRRALSLRLATPGSDELDIVDNMVDLGQAQTNAGAYAEAESTYVEAGRRLEPLAGEESARRVRAKYLTRYGSFLGMQGELDRAGPLLEEAVVLWREVDDPTALAESLISLNSLYRLSGNYEEAERVLLEADSIATQALGPSHPTTITIAFGLGILYSDQGRLDAADSVLQSTVVTVERVLGPNHPRLADFFESLGINQALRASYEVADSLMRRALVINETAVGPRHPSLVNILGNLSQVRLLGQMYEEAEQPLQRALSILEASMGPDHPQVAFILTQMGDLRRQGFADYAGAESLFLRALDIYEGSHGPDSPRTAVVLYALAEMYVAQERYAEAEPLIERASAIYGRLMEPDSPDLLRAIELHEEVQRRLGRDPGDPDGA
jgi:tetratricopeptide (TPR) repeat protein